MKSNNLRILICLALVITSFSCQKSKQAFKLLTPAESGISFKNELTPTEELNILTYLYYYNGAGLAIADFNNDGLNDIYFASNQGADQFYLNKGGLNFENVTDQSGIDNSTGWSTGVTHVDINSDGWMDIYVCKVGKYKSIQGSNLLYINQGPNENNIPVFKEYGKIYGLDIIAFSTQAAFFDYDLDGDVDMYLLAHSVHPNNSYGKGSNRELVDSLSGDRLLENVDGKFKDVSKEAGIFQGKIGYGLGLSVGDLNGDGYPDIYVGNDFFENDYLYQNNGNKTFSELNSSDCRVLGHTSHYSMGNCLADINNDGRVDIMSLDMLPEDRVTLKSSGVEDEYPVYRSFLQNGYSPQFMQNTLHLNGGDNIYSEIGFQAGIAATEWSWGILAADFDMDGFKDFYITNGILGATNDMDYINYVSQDLIQKAIEKNMGNKNLEFSSNIPQKKIRNYSFRNNKDASFTDVTNEWFGNGPSFSNGGAYCDLDNDGDLDLVINNINEPAFLFENLTNDKQEQNYLKIKFKGSKRNTFGIGAKVEVFANGMYLYEENFPVKSYLSSVPCEFTLGLGSNKIADSVRVIWPDLATQLIKDVNSNQSILLDYQNATFDRLWNLRLSSGIDYLTNAEVELDFVHLEESTLDFDRDPLVPFALSNEGPSIAVADINGDLLDDIFIGGAKMQSSQLFIQDADGHFTSNQLGLFQQDAKSEDVNQVFFDADNDLDMDLLVVSGGNEFSNGEPLKPRFYINESGSFFYQKSEFENISINASVVRTIDLENDGDNDVIIGSNVLQGNFGESASNFIFKNDGTGHFENVTQEVSQDFENAGLVTGIEIVDLDKNGFSDVITVGAWMPVTLFLNDGKSWIRRPLPDTEGWWGAIAVEDFDKDGDIDFVAGNWGNNSRLSASKNEPIKLYRDDFDQNGTKETLIIYYLKGQETFLSSMDELAKQVPSIRKRYQSYHEFGLADVGEVFDVDKSSIKKEAKLLSSCYFENKGNGVFQRHVLPASAQMSSVNAITVDDFNNDGQMDLFMVGNNYEISTQLGRMDASHGVMMLNDGAGFFKEHTNQKFNVAGAARDIKKIVIKGDEYFVIAMNNDRPLFLKKKKIE